MPPKKDAKKGGDKKGGADLTPEEKMAMVEQTLEGEKNNLVRACDHHTHRGSLGLNPARHPRVSHRRAAWAESMPKSARKV